MSSTLLLPRAAAKFISQHSQHVKCNTEGIQALAQKLLECSKTSPYDTSVWKTHTLNPNVADESAVEWIFVADTLNFSFWPDAGQAKFTAKFHDQEYTGYWAICAVMNKALEGGVPLTSSAYYSQVNRETMEIICQSSNQSCITLLEERTRVLNETGKILTEKFGGSFVNCVKKAGGSAVELLRLIVENFPSYRDEATFKGKRVAFYKRAQILVADIWACFEGQGLGEFKDIDEITMFADYRIPQALVYFNVLDYSQQLMDRLKKDDLLESGSEEEVEIRGNTIWAVELLSEELKRLQATDTATSHKMNAVLLDFYLWDYRRQHAKDMEHIPFHKTRCIYY